ncbi:hypothetical protein DPM19_31340 [Actinomadura craniellae]|uniref:non-specific serine/threonine protein kinase n=2 Tax=Actinomadura craniellae TaxID=2231787 RepID=A0A365GWQ2_9ACTN|nr:hypothetical protein DPM19_31340 [Actinomadura craniellae]
MGTVWHARDEILNREVAVKEVELPDRLTGAERSALCHRLVREARAAAALRHPGVATVHDVLVADGRPWIVMELLRARSLQQVLDTAGPLPPVPAARIGRAVLSVLDALHAAGFLHRDVKPGNVLLTDDGRVVLSDYGLAVRTGERTGFEGSPAYVSPEQARGESGTEASDLWSLGTLLYAAVEGRSPYARKGALASMVAVLIGEYEPPGHAAELGPVIEGLLRPDPADRLTTIQVAELLDRMLDARQEAQRGRRWYPATVAGLLLVIVVLGALAGWAVRWYPAAPGPVSLVEAGSATTSYTRPGSYRVRVPADWRRTEREHGVEWSLPGSGGRLVIAPAAGDAVAGLLAAEHQALADGRYSGYRRLRLEATPELGPGTAEWEFTWRDMRGLHSRVGGHDLFFTAPVDRWTPGQRHFDRVRATFRPAARS